MRALRYPVLLVCTLALAACGGPGVPQAQQYATVSGTVVDAATNAPIAGATVTVDTVNTATTGTNGAFSIGNLPNGPVEYAASAGPIYQTRSNDWCSDAAHAGADAQRRRRPAHPHLGATRPSAGFAGAGGCGAKPERRPFGDALVDQPYDDVGEFLRIVPHGLGFADHAGRHEFARPFPRPWRGPRRPATGPPPRRRRGGVAGGCSLTIDRVADARARAVEQRAHVLGRRDARRFARLRHHVADVDLTAHDAPATSRAMPLTSKFGGSTCRAIPGRARSRRPRGSAAIDLVERGDAGGSKNTRSIGCCASGDVRSRLRRSCRRRVRAQSASTPSVAGSTRPTMLSTRLDSLIAVSKFAGDAGHRGEEQIAERVAAAAPRPR